MFMQVLFTVFLIVHIVSGFTALVAGLIAMLTKKGGKQHRYNGKIYFAAMTGVFITSIYMSLAHNKPFLFMVGFFSYYLVVRGYRILYLKKIGVGENAKPVDWLVAGTGGLAGAGLIIYGIITGLLQSNFMGYVAIVFGTLSVIFSVKDITLFLKGAKDTMHWWYGHITAMGGGYIATATAFLVVNIHFLPGIIVWLTPTVTGSIIITATVIKYKKKFRGNQKILG
jgi:uncharacterized membrane protein